MTGSIICGVDGSISARGAAHVARELSTRLGLRLVFVRVVDDGAHDGEVASIAAHLHHLAEGAPEVEGGADWLVEAGHPADRLLAAAEEEDATLIVVGSTGPRSSLLGSISADVSRRAPCPVVVVAPGADRRLASDGAAESGQSRGGGYDGVSGSIRVGSSSERRKDNRSEPDFAGGFVRFNLGAREET